MNKNDYDLDKVVTDFINSSYQPYADGRYASYDYCYNYFLRSENLTSDIEKSCLVLGFYLASWGMFRGSSFLLQKSAKHFIPTIEYISKLPKSLWKIDVDNYDSGSIKEIQNVYKEIQIRLIPKDNADLTLITKVLLGVFGFVPAFDNYFCDTFRNIAKGQCGFRTLNEKSLSIIKRFYETNRKSIDNLSKQSFTIDFMTREKTEVNYTKAKIIDMYGFTIGLEKSKEKDMKIFAVYAEMEEKPRFYVEAKDSNELLKIMRKRNENGEPNGMFPCWDPVEISKEEMIQNLK